MDIVVFTDGSYLPKINRAGIGIHFPNAELDDISKRFTIEPLTNQRAELYAILMAIVKITKDIIDVKSITIYTDSDYSIKSLTVWIKKWVKNGWKTYNKKPVENTDLIKSIHHMMEQYKGQIKFVHVRSHTKKTDPASVGNSIADDLAVQGAKKNISKV